MKEKLNINDLVEIFECEISCAQASLPKIPEFEDLSSEYNITKNQYDKALEKAYDNEMEKWNDFVSQTYEKCGKLSGNWNRWN